MLCFHVDPEETLSAPGVARSGVDGLGCAAALAGGLITAVRRAMALDEEELQRLGKAAEERDLGNRRLERRRTFRL